MFSPKVSVIVPIYNVEHYVRKCIQSIIKQRYSNIEIILVNDGSTDSSYDICCQIANTDNRIKLINKRNGGVNSARNIGLSNATGDYIFFIDSDDSISEETISSTVEILNNNKCIDMVQIPIIDIDTNDNILSVYKPQKQSITGKKQLFLNWYKANCIFTGYLCGKLFRKNVFDNLLLPEDMIITEDAYIISDLCCRIKTATTSETGKYYYLQRLSSVTNSQFTSAKKRDFLKTRLKHYEFLRSLENVSSETVRYFLTVLRDFITYLQDKEHKDIVAINKLKTIMPKPHIVIKCMPKSTKDKLWYICIYILGLKKFISLYLDCVRLRLRFSR